MFCKNKDNGCNETISICKLSSHEHICPFRKVRCENKLCRKSGLARDFIEIKSTKMKNKAFSCSKKCKKIICFENKINSDKKIEALEKYYKLLKKLKQLSETVNLGD